MIKKFCIINVAFSTLSFTAYAFSLWNYDLECRNCYVYVISSVPSIMWLWHLVNQYLINEHVNTHFLERKQFKIGLDCYSIRTWVLPGYYYLTSYLQSQFCLRLIPLICPAKIGNPLRTSQSILWGFMLPICCSCASADLNI